MKSLKRTFLQDDVRGFTLVELMTSIVIISILTTIALVSIMNVRENSKIKAETATVESFKLNLTLYREANGDFPTEGSGWSDTANAMTPMITPEPILEDEWGNAYAYRNNYSSGGNYTMLCSTGPDGSLNTPEIALTNPSPQASGDDICMFIR